MYWVDLLIGDVRGVALRPACRADLVSAAGVAHLLVQDVEYVELLARKGGLDFIAPYPHLTRAGVHDNVALHCFRRRGHYDLGQGKRERTAALLEREDHLV